MRIRCDRCEARAVISSSKELSNRLKKLYCACTNVHCGHTFVMDLSFGHTLSPSAFDLPEKVRADIQRASRVEVRSALAGRV